MKPFLSLLLFVLPILGFSQQFVSLRDPVPPSANLLQVGQHIVLIHPFDLRNQSHKWLCLDSSLNITSAKRLISPDWQSVVAQTYFAANDAIIRVDQLIHNDSLYISLFRFDAFGNLRGRLDLDHFPATRIKLGPIPFYIVRSADRKLVGLVQAVSLEKDQITLSSFVVSDNLRLVSSSTRSYSYDPITSDMLRPLLDTDGEIFVPVVEKFDSYRLGSSLQLLPLGKGKHTPTEIPLNRKKIKEVRLQLDKGQLNMSALFSAEENKTDVAGIVSIQVNLDNPKDATTDYYFYNDAMKKALLRKFGPGGRKGSPLNHLSLLPRAVPGKTSYGVLLNPGTIVRKYETLKVPTITATDDLDRIKRQVAAVNSLTNPRRPQNIRPMSAAEANTAVALRQRPSSYESERFIKTTPPSGPHKDKEHPLLLFSMQPTSSTLSYQLVKIKTPGDPEFDFFNYAEVDGVYHALHYKLPTLNRVQLISSTIGHDHKPVQKLLLEEKNRIIAAGYPTLIYKNKKLIAVYEDRYTGDMGLMGVDLK